MYNTSYSFVILYNNRKKVIDYNVTKVGQIHSGSSPKHLIEMAKNFSGMSEEALLSAIQERKMRLYFETHDGQKQEILGAKDIKILYQNVIDAKKELISFREKILDKLAQIPDLPFEQKMFIAKLIV